MPKCSFFYISFFSKICLDWPTLQDNISIRIDEKFEYSFSNYIKAKQEKQQLNHWYYIVNTNTTIHRSTHDDCSFVTLQMACPVSCILSVWVLCVQCANTEDCQFQFFFLISPHLNSKSSPTVSPTLSYHRHQLLYPTPVSHSSLQLLSAILISNSCLPHWDV